PASVAALVELALVLRCLKFLLAELTVARRFYFGEKAADDIARGQSFTLSFEVGHDAMAQHGRSKGLNVFDGDRIAALQDRARLGAENQILGCARARAPFDVVLHVRWGIRPLGAGALSE